MHPRSPHRRRAVGTALVLAAATAAACSTGASEVATPTSTTSTSGTAAPDVEPATTATTTAATPHTTETTAANPEQQVLAAYQAFIDTWFTANDPPNPADSSIDRYLTGDARALLLSEIERNRRSGVVLRRPANSVTGIRDWSASVDGGSARLIVCLVDDGQVLLAANGAPLNSRIVTRKIEATLSQTDGMWRVARNTFIREEEGTPLCDAS